MASTRPRPGENGTAYINGRIYTVNPRQPWAEAFAVSAKGIFTAIGSNEEMRKKAKDESLIVSDLGGHFIMPGIHDAHVHMLASGISMTSHIKLPGHGLTNDNVADELRKGSCGCKFANIHEDWLIAHNFLIDNFDRKALDVDYPDTPVLIRGGAAHSAFMNTAALERAGYSIEDEPDGQGTRYFRDSNGHLTGEMAENSLTKAMLAIPQPGLPHIQRVLLAAQKKLHAAGVTSCQEASANTPMLQGLRALEKQNQLKLHMFPHIVHAPEWIGDESASSLHSLIETATSTYQSQHVDTRFVKIILDGVPLPPYSTHAPLLEENATNDHGTCVDDSKLLMPAADLLPALLHHDSHVRTVKIHCTGQGATRFALQTLRSVRASNPSGPRHEIAHCSGVHAEDYAQFRELRVTAEMSPAFFFAHPVTAASGGLMDWDFGSMQQAGAAMSLGSDWGAGDAPDLLPCLQAVVETLGHGDRGAGGEIVVRLLTMAGAEAVGREGELGSLEVGKVANFVRVEGGDLVKGEFEQARVTGTWFEGECVFEKGK
ncbi:hypothetical protein MBLNU230_g5264t1 [Neophaeotheca triangularis]